MCSYIMGESKTRYLRMSIRHTSVLFTGKEATQSSTFPSSALYSFEAGHGVDGIYESSGSMSTEAEVQPWWMVNLEKPCFVYEVKIFNSPECKCMNVDISVE